jgi:hypothetical protein
MGNLRSALIYTPDVAALNRLNPSSLWLDQSTLLGRICLQLSIVNLIVFDHEELMPLFDPA